MFIPAIGAAIFGVLQVRLTKSAVRIDNAIFRLHHTFTAAIFIIASILAAYNMTFQPMVCEGHHISASFINGYCSVIARYVPYSSPQGKSHLSNTDGTSEMEKVAYYKWVPYVLLIQGLLFLIPYWLWKVFEDEKMQKLTETLMNQGNEDDRQERVHRLVTYLLNTRHFNKMYAILFYACEELNFVIALANIMYLDSFAGRTFSKHGLTAVDLLNTNQINRTDSMVDVFPHVIKCTYVTPSRQKHDAVCVLPFNDTLEKIYVYLWCWLVFVITMATVSLLHRVVVLTCPSVRTLLLIGKASPLHKQQVQKIVDTGKLGDFLVLYMLKKNIDPVTYQDILPGLAARLDAAEAQTETNMCL